MRRHVHQQIEFLSVDVEGHERQVLEGGDWRRWRPRLLIVKATRPTTDLLTHDQWEELLFAADYLFAIFDGINRYYLRAEDRNLLPRLSTPVNFLDDYRPFEGGTAELSGRVRFLEAALEQSQQAVRGQRVRLKETRRELDFLWNKLGAAEKRLAKIRSEPAPPTESISPPRPSTAVRFNKACELEDFADPEIIDFVRQCPWLPLARRLPDYPKGWEHAKDWEVAMTLRTFRHFGRSDRMPKSLGSVPVVKSLCFR